jgi:hypothetical protein
MPIFKSLDTRRRCPNITSGIEILYNLFACTESLCFPHMIQKLCVDCMRLLVNADVIDH